MLAFVSTLGMGAHEHTSRRCSRIVGLQLWLFCTADGSVPERLVSAEYLQSCRALASQLHIAKCGWCM